MAPPCVNRRSSRRNSPSPWSRLEYGARQLALRRSSEPLNNVRFISDIQSRILSAIDQSQSGEWVLVKISPLRVLKGYISPTWKREIDLATKSIILDRCSSTMTKWRRHYHILPSKAATTLTLQKFWTDCLPLINGEVHAEHICSVPKQFRTCPLSTLYHSRYNIWEKHMSVECADVSN